MIGSSYNVGITGNILRTRGGGCCTTSVPGSLLSGPSREVMGHGGPATKVLDNMRSTRLEFKNWDVEELWHDRFSRREKSARKWVGFGTFWQEGFAPGAPPKARAPGTPRTRVMGSGLDPEQDIPRIEKTTPREQ